MSAKSHLPLVQERLSSSASCPPPSLLSRSMNEYMAALPSLPEAHFLFMILTRAAPSRDSLHAFPQTFCTVLKVTHQAAVLVFVFATLAPSTCIHLPFICLGQGPSCSILLLRISTLQRAFHIAHIHLSQPGLDMRPMIPAQCTELPHKPPQLQLPSPAASVSTSTISPP